MTKIFLSVAATGVVLAVTAALVTANGPAVDTLVMAAADSLTFTP